MALTSIRKTTTPIIITLLIGLLTSGLSYATPPSPQKLQAINPLYKLIQDQIKQKIGQKLSNPKISIKKISSRLALPACQVPVEISDDNPEKYYGRITFKLSCATPFWKLHVGAKIQGDLPVIITVKGILKQAVITKGDVAQVLLPYQKVNKRAFISTDRVIGMRAKRAIGPNTILTVDMLQPPYLVFRNQKIRIITRIGNLKVESTGIALKNGTYRQQIPVKNSSSKKIIRGIVIAPNTVEIP